MGRHDGANRAAPLAAIDVPELEALVLNGRVLLRRARRGHGLLHVLLDVDLVVRVCPPATRIRGRGRLVRRDLGHGAQVRRHLTRRLLVRGDAADRNAAAAVDRRDGDGLGHDARDLVVGARLVRVLTRVL